MPRPSICFRKPSKPIPKIATYHYHLGMALRETGQLSATKKQLEQTLAINPNYSQAGEIRKMLAESHN